MMASLDGRIDCEMTEQIDDTNHYYGALAQLACPSTLEGKTTLAMHYAQDGEFRPQKPQEDAGPQLYKAVDAEGYAVGVDTRGTLLWDDNTTELFGRPLLMILSEKCSQEYLDYLKNKHISFITIGSDGQVTAIRFDRKSGDPFFDQLVEKTIRQAAPMPRFPALMRQSSTQLPVRFIPGNLGRM